MKCSHFLIKTGITSFHVWRQKKKIAETIKTEGWQTMVCVCRGRDKGVGGKPPKLNFQTVKHKPS